MLGRQSSKMSTWGSKFLSYLAILLVCKLQTAGEAQAVMVVRWNKAEKDAKLCTMSVLTCTTMTK